MPAVANPEDIDLDEGDAEEEAEEAGANIQLETKPVPVRVMLLVVSRRKSLRTLPVLRTQYAKYLLLYVLCLDQHLELCPCSMEIPHRKKAVFRLRRTLV